MSTEHQPDPTYGEITHSGPGHRFGDPGYCGGCWWEQVGRYELPRGAMRHADDCSGCLIDAVSADVHQAWIEAKKAQGITSRPSAEGIEQMVPYADLPDHLQELDRATVRAVLASPTLSAALAARPSADAETLRRMRPEEFGLNAVLARVAAQHFGPRPNQRCHDHIELLRAMLQGKPVPFYTDVLDLLSDVELKHLQEADALRDRAEAAESAGRRSREAVARLWPLVYAAGKRLTMRTAEVRAALDAR